MIDRIALLADTRLPPDARIIGLFVMELGDGWHEIPRDQIGALTDGLSEETIRRHIRRLESTGWLETNTKTGRRPTQYRTIPMSDSGNIAPLRQAIANRFADLLPLAHEGDTVLPLTHEGQTKSLPLVHEGQKPSTPHPRGVDVHVVVEEGGRSRKEEARARDAGHEIDERVVQHIEADGTDLTGFRSALFDYLAARVQTDRQWPYVCTVRTWLQGSTAAPRGLGKLDREEQVLMIASALNELLQDDELQYRSARGQIGSTNTLRTKIEYLLKRRTESTPPPGATRPAGERPAFPDPERDDAVA